MSDFDPGLRGDEASSGPPAGTAQADTPAARAEESVAPTSGTEERARAAEAAPGAVDDAARRTLAALADVMIPAADGMPSASDAGVAGPWLDEVLRSRPDIADDLLRVLRDAGTGNAEAALAVMQRERPDDFAVLEVVVPGAYYMDPRIRAMIGYPGQEAIPIVHTEVPDYEEDGLLASVIGRGTIYRS